MRYSYDTLLSDTDIDTSLLKVLNDNGIVYYGQLRLHDFYYYKSLKGFGAKKMALLKEFVGDDWVVGRSYFFDLKEQIDEADKYINNKRMRIIRAIDDYARYYDKVNDLHEAYNFIMNLEKETNND